MHTFAMFRTLMLEGATVVMVAVRPLISCSAWVVPNGLHAAHRLHCMCIYRYRPAQCHSPKQLWC